MKYIDIHTHSYYHAKDTTLVINVFPEEKEKFNLPALFSTGLHPWHIRKSTWKSLVNEVKKSSAQNKVIAIGETGFDKAINVPFDIQRSIFEAHLEMAGSLKKPLIIHCVRSYSELLSYRKRSDQSLPWIFHWFNSTMQTAEELIKKNCYLSFGHMLFKEQSKACKVFLQIPLNHVFFETDDAGYSIKEIYDRAAQLRNIPMYGLKQQIENNFNHCFPKKPGNE